MRILHFADLHIGVEAYGRPATEKDLEALPDWFAPDVDRRTYLGVSTRFLDFLCALDELVDFALREGVDLVLFSGDTYKSREPSQTHQREFLRRVARLREAGIPLFLLVGNHDMPHSPWRATTLDLFPSLRVPAVTVGNRFQVYGVETRSGPLQVVALPWVRGGDLLARGELRGASLDEVRQHIAERLTQRVMDLVRSLDPDRPAVLSGHLTVDRAETGSERSMMLGQDYVVLTSALAQPGLDYLALGHVHKHQRVWEEPLAVYSGSLQRVDFSEEGEEKGFCVVDLDPSRPPGQRLLRYEFVPVRSARRFLTVEVEVPDGVEDPTRMVLEALARRSVRGAVVRLKVSLPAEVADRLDEPALRRALAEAYAIGPLEKHVRYAERRGRWAPEDLNLSPAEALRRFLEEQERVDPAVRRRALELGLHLLEQVEGG